MNGDLTALGEAKARWGTPTLESEKGDGLPNKVRSAVARFPSRAKGDSAEELGVESADGAFDALLE